MAERGLHCLGQRFADRFVAGLRATDAACPELGRRVLLGEIFDSNRDVSHTSFLPRIARIPTDFPLHLPQDGRGLHEVGAGADDL